MSSRLRKRVKEVLWGNEPQLAMDVKAAHPDTPLDVENEVKSLSYVARKGEQIDVWRHDFSLYKGKYPRLLIGLDVEHGEFHAPSFEGELVTLGMVIDVEYRDGRVVMPPAMFVSTPASSNAVILTSPLDIYYALERRKNGTPFIDRRGLVK